MIKRHIQTACILFISGLFLLLALPGTAHAKLVPARDPRGAVLDADLVVLVKRAGHDRFRIEEIYFGESKPGDIIRLPGFKLYTSRRYDPDIVEPITPNTRILLFLKHKDDDPSAWELTSYGYHFFWVHTLDKVDDLRKMARDTVALRKSWEAARDVPDQRSRVEALWPFLWNTDGYFLNHTEDELKKVGPVAGDYIAEQFDTVDHNQRMELIGLLGAYASSSSHQVLLNHLKKLQQAYQEFLVKKGPKVKNLSEDWNTALDEGMEIDGELYYGLAGLSAFKDRSDLPYIRELALWLVKYQLSQPCDGALLAFTLMPDRANLPVIDSILSAFPARPNQGDPLISWRVVGMLEAQIYPEAIPLLVRFLDSGEYSEYTRYYVQETLKKITGTDLGENPKPWLDWYEAQKQKNSIETTSAPNKQFAERRKPSLLPYLVIYSLVFSIAFLIDSRIPPRPTFSFGFLLTRMFGALFLSIFNLWIGPKLLVPWLWSPFAYGLPILISVMLIFYLKPVASGQLRVPLLKRAIISTIVGILFGLLGYLTHL